MIKSFHPVSETVLVVQLVKADNWIPCVIEFVFVGHTVNMNFWVIQALRRNVPMFEADYNADSPYPQRENKIAFIKALRNTFSLGLKEAKDIAEWFMDNVDRDVVGTL